MMDWNMIMSSVFEHITVPIIILIGGVIIAVLKPYAKKISTALTMKTEMESLEKMTQAKSNLMDQIDKLVESAVGANMQIAEKMKANGHKLTEEEIEHLNQSAKDLVITSLPIDILDPEGDLYKLIGGEEKLDKMIMSLMEKHVYGYKLKRLQSDPAAYQVPMESSPEIPYTPEGETSEEENIGFVTPPEVLGPSGDEPIEEEGTYTVHVQGDETGASGSIEIPPKIPTPPARFGLG